MVYDLAVMQRCKHRICSEVEGNVGLNFSYCDFLQSNLVDYFPKSKIREDSVTQGFDQMSLTLM